MNEINNIVFKASISPIPQTSHSSYFSLPLSPAPSPYLSPSLSPLHSPYWSHSFNDINSPLPPQQAHLPPSSQSLFRYNPRSPAAPIVLPQNYSRTPLQNSPETATQNYSPSSKFFHNDCPKLFSNSSSKFFHNDCRKLF